MKSLLKKKKPGFSEKTRFLTWFLTWFLTRFLTRFLMIILSLLIAALLNGCTKPIPEPVDHPNLLVAVEGDTLLKREGWSDYIPVGFGTIIQYDDLLQVDGTATILCGDLAIKAVSGRDSCPCPPGPGRLEYEGAHYRAIPDTVPYIQHPRNTLVLDPRPLLRWHDTGASSYTVAIVSGGETVWSQPGVAGNSIRYPDEAPALQPDTDYLLIVQDGTHTSGEEPTRGLGFQVLGEAERAIIEERRDEILALSSLDSPARDFALAVYYATWQAPADETEPADGRGLWGEAWLLLESVAQTQNEPAVYLWMGDVLAAIKLSDEAQVAYQDTLGSAGALGDLESQAAAHAGLWRVTRDENHLEQALRLYARLGDEGAVQALRE